MKNFIPRLINFYARTIGTILSFILPIGAIVGLATLQFDPKNFSEAGFYNWVHLLWLVLLGNSFLLFSNGFLVNSHFSREVNKLVRSGIPIASASGFRNLEKNYRTGNFNLIFIFLLSLVSYGFFYLAIQGIEFISNAIFLAESGIAALTKLSFYLAVSMLIFALSATIVIKIPPLLLISEGKLQSYYTAQRHPYVLRSYFYDTIYYLLDPVTRVYFFKWCKTIEESLTDHFAPNLQPQSDRSSLAVQNVLVLLYIHYRFSDLLDNKELDAEIARIIQEDKIDEIMNSKILNRKEWKKIFKNLENSGLENFLIIDRILLTLQETPQVIRQKKYWVVSSVSPTQTLNETKDILFFLLNSNPEQKEPAEITLDFKGGMSLLPGDFTINFNLSPYSDYIQIPADVEELKKDNNRLLIKMLTAILYQGTGIWITIHSDKEGSNVGSIAFHKGTQTIDTVTFNWRVVKGMKFYVKTYGPKALASLGFLLPLVRTFIGL